ncbi:MAG: GNAT family N-acetyltransferase [Streptococcaceae bacterium]|jgi:predicted GNAT family N-acyltransferase|nr:GNAT family N-acetyltransferase [Streptococcaceae bacterium]
MTDIKQTRDTLSTTYQDALKIRYEVFVKEQGVPYSLEVESPVEEAAAIHFVAYDHGEAIGTVRLLTRDDHATLVQRMAVRKPYRNQGYASDLLNAALSCAKTAGIQELTLHAQLTAHDFYSRFGFEDVGSPFEEAGIQHITMQKTLD